MLDEGAMRGGEGPGRYDFFAPRKIVFGWGRRAEVGALGKSLGDRALVVVGSKTLERAGVVGQMVDALGQAGIAADVIANIDREPEVSDVDQLVANIRSREAGGSARSFLVAIGGGSAIDLAKAAGAVATNRQSDTVLDFLEGVGRGFQVDAAPLPLMAVPTTSGTGSEATKNAVISSYAPAFKKSIRSDQMVPNVVLVDPELTVSMPPQVTAWTGMDAITQLIESYVTKKAQPITKAIAIDGLRRAIPAIATAYRDGACRWAREQMSHAALLSGIALANSGLGLAHGVAAALGVHCRISHGLACAVMLPTAMTVNRSVCETAFRELAEAMTGRRFESDATGADVAVDTVRELCAIVDIPQSLSELGVRRDQIPELVTSSRGNSMNGNPKTVSDDELRALLERLVSTS